MPQKSISSKSQGKIRETLLQTQRQQTLAEGREEQIQLPSNKGPPTLLPGGLPGYGETSGQGESLGENQGLEPPGVHSKPLLHQSGKPTTPPCPTTSQHLQSNEPSIQEPQKYPEEQSLEELNLRRNDQDGQIPPRDLSTSGEGQDTEARSHASGSSRILENLSMSSSIFLPEYPNPIDPGNEAFHHDF